MLKGVAITISLVAVLSTGAPAFGGPRAAGPMDRHAMFCAVAAMYGLDPALLEAIAAVESHGHSDAISSAGAMGLMQLMPATAARFGVDDPFDPVESALGAARFLSYLRDGSRFGRHLPDLLAAYNAGQGTVERFGGVPPYLETQEYVRRVLWFYLLGVPPLDSAGPKLPARRAVSHAPTTQIRPPRNGDLAVLSQLAELKRARNKATVAARARER
jgi:soluble lytic murein transglycosylase-like protein